MLSTNNIYSSNNFLMQSRHIYIYIYIYDIMENDGAPETFKMLKTL